MVAKTKTAEYGCKAWFEVPIGKDDEGVLTHNTRLTRRAALETPGTASYFHAVMAALLREAEKRSKVRDEVRAARPVKVAVHRTSGATVHSDQKCHGCERRITAGETGVIANREWPVIACGACAPKASKPEAWAPVEVVAVSQKAKTVAA